MIDPWLLATIIFTLGLAWALFEQSRLDKEDPGKETLQFLATLLGLLLVATLFSWNATVWLDRQSKDQSKVEAGR